MSRSLVIVESPTKARTIAGFLGDDYVVEASMGHVRDLPRKASELPARLRDRPWARLGVDVDGDFAPVYVIPRDKAAKVRALRLAVRDADEILLATDEDREGEAIAWHLVEVTKPQVPVRRMVFHEITPVAVRRALQQTRPLDPDLVSAQEARRVLDRLVGWDVSELLWKKVAPKLSAGRVQSVATRLVVERERARIAFRSGHWWEVQGVFASGRAEAPPSVPFQATLTSVDGIRVATSRDFDASSGTVTDPDLVLLDGETAGRLAAAATGIPFAVEATRRTEWRRRPAPPFVTATLQQEAGRRLHLSASRTMQLAQRLYEQGYITYMRTDSTELSEEAIAAARADVRERFGDGSLPPAPRRYKRKGKHSQEAHEAIRPTGPRFRSPLDVAGRVDADQARLYELIWRRTLASQMTDAVGHEVRASLGAGVESGERLVFAASGRIVTDRGYLAVWDSDGGGGQDAAAARQIESLVEGETARCSSAEAAGHETQPPARFTEASLVKELERLGVGRPSTYATILRTIVDRGYVRKSKGALVPTWAAFAVVGLLEANFPDLVDPAFTARMEDSLDEIAAGNRDMAPWLRDFYSGTDSAPGLRSQVEAGAESIDPRAVTTIEILPHDGESPIEVHFGRYGPYVESGGRRVQVPDDLAPDELTAARLAGMSAAVAESAEERALGVDPETGAEITLRHGRYGPFVQRGEGKIARRAGLLSSSDPATLALEDAIGLLALPRTLGADSDGTEVEVHLGRYGPYVKRGRDTRDLDEARVFTVTLEEALELLSRPKARRGSRRGGRGAGSGSNSTRKAGVIADLGEHPVTGARLVVREGRYGPYVTDGKANASVPKGTAPEEVTLEGAVELLNRRARTRSRSRRSGGRPR